MMQRTLVPLVLLMCSAGMVVESRTANGPSDGFPQSGYAWPKTLLWHGIRSPPGSLWFFYVSLVGTVVWYLFTLIGMCCEKNHEIDLLLKSIPIYGKIYDIRMAAELQSFILGTGLLYLGLGVMNLSDVMEAYLAGMVSIQVILSTPRVSGNKVSRLILMSAFQLSAVFGIAMLDSYHPLNVLNTVYSVFGSVIIVIMYLTENKSLVMRAIIDTILSIVQTIFSFVAFGLATGVEGTHRRPMLVILVTGCVFTGIARSSVSAVDSDREPEPELPSPSATHL